MVFCSHEAGAWWPGNVSDVQSLAWGGGRNVFFYFWRCQQPWNRTCTETHRTCGARLSPTLHTGASGWDRLEVHFSVVKMLSTAYFSTSTMKCCQSRLNSHLCHWFCFFLLQWSFSATHSNSWWWKWFTNEFKCTDVPKSGSPPEVYDSSAVCQHNIVMHNTVHSFSFFGEVIYIIQLIGRLKLLKVCWQIYVNCHITMQREVIREHLKTKPVSKPPFKSVPWLILPLLELLLWFVTLSFWSLGVPGLNRVHVGLTLVPNMSVQ